MTQAYRVYAVFESDTDKHVEVLWYAGYSVTAAQVAVAQIMDSFVNPDPMARIISLRVEV